MTDEIRNMIVDELSKTFSPEQLREVDIAVAKALQDYTVTKNETLPAKLDDKYPIEVREFIARKRVKGCSEGTIRRYKFALDKFIQWSKKDLKEMTDLDILVYLDYLQSNRKMSNRTLDGERSVLSSFYTFLHDSGKIAVNPMKSVDPIKYTSKVREPLTDMEMEQIRNACRNEKEKALVEVLYSTGARISEIIGLDINDIDMENRRAIITGKGDKQRFVFFNARSLFAIKEYLESRDDDDPALFVRDRAPHGRLTVAGAQYIIKEIGKRAGINRPLFPHLFRHTCATNMLTNGAPINEVSKILGHEKIETTLIYAKSSSEMLSASHKRYIA